MASKALAGEKQSFSPLGSLVNAVAALLAGRPHFPRGRGSQPGAAFRPRFPVAGLSPRANIWFSPFMIRRVVPGSVAYPLAPLGDDPAGGPQTAKEVARAICSSS
jgi:hypothetical protein